MSIVPGLTSKLQSNVNAILSSADRDNLPVLNLGVGAYVDRTIVMLFIFLHDLSQAIPKILLEGWVHEWPTYSFIPDHLRNNGFLYLF